MEESLKQLQERLAQDDAHILEDEHAIAEQELAVGTVREQVTHRLGLMGKLVASLSGEQCKEDHGTFMKTQALVEEVAISLETLLINWESDVHKEQASTKPVSRFSLFQPKDDTSDKLNLEIQLIRQLRDQVGVLRKRPTEIYQVAVDHDKRLLLYDRQDYQDLQKSVVQLTKQLAQEKENHGYTALFQQLRAAIDNLNEALKRIDQECADKALRQIQESDNGPA